VGAERMSLSKPEIIESLRSKGIDPIKLEKELMNILRSGSGAYEVRSYLKNLFEGDKV
jgi:hypothetical protein